MVFSSPIFLTAFLPLVIIATILVPKQLRNLLLLGASLTFYWWGAAQWTVLLLWVVAVSYFGAKRAESKGWLYLTLGATLAPLLWFKYASFFSEIAFDALGAVGIEGTPINAQLLPIGISFFTFQALSYVIDVKRGDAEPLDRADKHLLYITLFPQLIAGPIVRYAQLRDQLYTRTMSVDKLAIGATRFAHGLAKKVIIADAVAPIADAAFADGPSRTMLGAWIGLLAYTVQIYFDFSGYSDMAIGLGTMLGFTFPENFNRPYSSYSIREFWTRWHITLSSWFRDYVYIPLGGSREGSAKTYRNLSIVFLLTALWHGAAWTFLVWGGIHGVWLIVERVTGLADATRLPAVRRGLTLFIVMSAWVWFRAPGISMANEYFLDLVGFQGGPLRGALVTAMTIPNVLMLTVGVLSFFLPRDKTIGPWISRIDPSGVADISFAPQAARVGYIALTIPLSMVLIASNDFSPFLYFQF